MKITTLIKNISYSLILIAGIIFLEDTIQYRPIKKDIKHTTIPDTVYMIISNNISPFPKENNIALSRNKSETQASTYPIDRIVVIIAEFNFLTVKRFMIAAIIL